MKLALFQQIVELNQSFDHLIAGLTKLESVPFFQRDLIQHARSDVEIARVYANREFFDNFEEIVENDAKWAYRFQRAYDVFECRSRFFPGAVLHKAPPQRLTASQQTVLRVRE